MKRKFLWWLIRWPVWYMCHRVHLRICVKCASEVEEYAKGKLCENCVAGYNVAKQERKAAYRDKLRKRLKKIKP